MRNWRNHTHTPFKIQPDSITDGTMNWIKLRLVDKMDLLTATEPMGQVAGSDSAHSHSSPEASASGPATHTPVDAMPTVKSTILQNPKSARGTPVSHTLTPRPRISTRVNKGITPR